LNNTLVCVKIIYGNRKFRNTKKSVSKDRKHDCFLVLAVKDMIKIKKTPLSIGKTLKPQIKLPKNSVKRKPEPSFSYKPIKAAPHTPPYKIHKYFARRPYNVFEQLIQNFSLKNDIILDPFCGGGVTIYEGLIKQRKMIGCDINPLSIFIIKNMVKRFTVSDIFNKIIAELENYLKYLQGDYLKFNHDNKCYQINWSEMALSVRCPNCGRSTPLSNNLRQNIFKYYCSNVDCIHNFGEGFEVSSCERRPPQYLFLVNYNNKINVQKEYDTEDNNTFTNHIMFLKNELEKDNIIIPQDTIPLDWDRQFEDGLLKRGIIFFQDLFTKRNLYILLLLLNKINIYKDAVSGEEYELLRMIFSNILKDSNIMSFTNTGWQSGKPTTWSKHAYWIPNQFCEVSILPIFKNSVDRVLSVIKYNLNIDYIPKSACTFTDLKKNDNNLLLYNKPVNLIDLPDNSIDAIITDPPYGSNVQYLELSHFWYPWNKDLYDNYPLFELEAIANRKKGFKGAKNEYDYENNLYAVFANSYKCLKPEKYMVLTFNNKKITTWLGLLFAIFKAGFSFENMYFQDGVENYRQTAHTKAEGSPYGDFIYVFKKPGQPYLITEYYSEEQFASDLDAIFRKHLEKTIDKNNTILNMFLEVMPFIDGFAKSYLIKNESHSLYSIFNKNYLEKLFVNYENK